MNEKLPELREKANRLPLLPGVYIMKDARGEVMETVGTVLYERLREQI